MPPTAPAAPVTRISLSCLCFVVMSLTTRVVRPSKPLPDVTESSVGLACPEDTRFLGLDIIIDRLSEHVLWYRRLAELNANGALRKAMPPAGRVRLEGVLST
jgi:hypothetical protein